MARHIPELEELKATYKRLFKRGLAMLLPTILTVYIIFFCIQFLQQYVAAPINRQVKAFLIATSIGNRLAVHLWGVEEEAVRLGGKVLESAVESAYGSWFGFLLGLIGVFLAGVAITTFVGSRLWTAVENRFARLPFVRAVYPYAKQVTDFFILSEKELENEVESRSVVALEYPRRGMYSFGFVTGAGFRSVDRRVGKRYVNVFIPSAPTPFTGYVVLAAEDELIPLSLTPEEVIRFITSCGVVVPPTELPEGHGETERLPMQEGGAG